MKEPPEDIKIRLLFILHRGLAEVRLLSGENRCQQIFDLADALELIPGMLKNWNHKHLEQVRTLLKTYQEKYPTSWGFDFLSRLSDQPPLEF
jgi:hypothetical protein